MTLTRREALTWGLSVGAFSSGAMSAEATPHATPSSTADPWARDAEGRRMADLGNGHYLNPVLPGDHPDPTVLRDGDDYYATFSSFDFAPGLVIWHSRDLINWVPIVSALPKPPAIVFASDLVKHEGRYYLYIPFIPAPWSTQMPAAPSIYVVHADSIHGPWSDPVDLGIRGYIDPGHVVGEDGHRYLFLSGVARVRLRPDGLATDGDPVPAYAGWRYPDTWVTENYALEGPKLFRRGDYFYLLCAVGGTSGPPTGHMVTLARSRSVLGPWEDCPHNPIVHTTDVRERWWSRGHATRIEGPNGTDYLIYHGYENGYRSLGRQALLEPIEWTVDGWFRATGGDLSQPMPMPTRLPRVARPTPASDDFSALPDGARWTFFGARPNEAERIRMDDGLVLAAHGSSPSNCVPLLGVTGDRAYECAVEVELLGEAEAALLLWFNTRLYLGMSHDGQRMKTFGGGIQSYWQEPAPAVRRLWLRIVNDHQTVTFYYGTDGEHWTRHGVRSEVSGYHANTMNDLQSLRPALAAIGNGAVRFRHYRYRGLR